MLKPKLIYTLFLVLVVKSSYSQNIKGVAIVKYADAAEIKFKALPGYTYQAQNHDLKFLKSLVIDAKKAPELKCDSTGEIIYYKNKKLIFTVYFSTKGTGSKYNNGAVVFSSNNDTISSLTNYGTGMLVNEIYYSQTQK